MKSTRVISVASLALAGLLLIGLQTTAAAQGRGRGGGGGGGNAGGSGRGIGGPVGPMSGPGVDRGIGTASDRSRGRSDDGLGRASERSGGRSDEGLNRARNGRHNGERDDRRLGDAPRTDKDLHRFQGIARKLNTTPEALRAGYAAALAANPDLKFGQFVAAHVIADNLSGRYPNITTQAILDGLSRDRSIGQTLQDLGLSSREAKEAEKASKRQIKERMERS